MNRMSDLLNKIERRLGFLVCKLPENIDKTHWAEDVIATDTIPAFSRNFPHQITVYLNRDTPRDRDGYYLISEKMTQGANIIGLKDISWVKMSQNSMYNASYGFPSVFNDVTGNTDYTFDDVAMAQCTADLYSTFQTAIIPDFQYPNRIKFTMTGRNDYQLPYDNCPIDLFVEHPLNLMTISPTMMRWFEDLATADVASYLYQNLKYYDGLETMFINVDLKLDELRDWANKRDDIINYLEENRVSAANKNQPIMFCV